MNPTLRRVLHQLRAAWMLLAVCVILAIASPVFATSANLLNVALATSVTALLAAGQTFVIILAEIDLSVGAILGFSAAITAMVLRHHSTITGIVVGLAVGAAAGLVNGLLVTKTRMPSFIATLATLSILSGLALQLTQGNPVSVTDYNFQNIGQARIAGIPTPVWIMIVVFVIFGILLARTRFGRGGRQTVRYLGRSSQNPRLRHQWCPRRSGRVHRHRALVYRRTDSRHRARTRSDRRRDHRRHQPGRRPR